MVDSGAGGRARIGSPGSLAPCSARALATTHRGSRRPEPTFRPRDTRSSARTLRSSPRLAPSSTVLLRLSRDEEGVAELRTFLERWPQAPGADRARLYVESPRRARERFAPDFSVRTLQGEEISLAALRGRTVVLDFWGTWCPPCVPSLPELKDLLRRYDTDRLVLLSVSVGDEEDAWRELVARKGMTWPQYRDADRRLVEAFQVRAFPTYVVIDGEGAIPDPLQGMDERHSLAYRLRSRLDALLEAKR